MKTFTWRKWPLKKHTPLRNFHKPLLAQQMSQIQLGCHVLMQNKWSEWEEELWFLGISRDHLRVILTIRTAIYIGLSSLPSPTNPAVSQKSLHIIHNDETSDQCRLWFKLVYTQSSQIHTGNHLNLHSTSHDVRLRAGVAHHCTAPCCLVNQIQSIQAR